MVKFPSELDANATQSPSGCQTGAEASPEVVNGLSSPDTALTSEMSVSPSLLITTAIWLPSGDIRGELKISHSVLTGSSVLSSGLTHISCVPKGPLELDA